ncbi:hypothetical protein [Variovorax sp. dw_954]|uniref:hypothetical protein n=1 Tax=Variovorax sp. dw_954 TaxID=2720078 RepID=UPI001BD2E7D3|nr:hypothetical protein [Variovorax sp. dw_954]
MVAVFVLLEAFIALFNWNGDRVLLERYISKKTEREFHSSNLRVRLGMSPTIQMRDVYFGNAKWSKDERAMAKIEMLEFSVSFCATSPIGSSCRAWRSHARELVFERLPDNRKNWILSDPSDTSPSKLRISALSVEHGNLRYIDHGESFSLDI